MTGLRCRSLAGKCYAESWVRLNQCPAEVLLRLSSSPAGLSTHPHLEPGDVGSCCSKPVSGLGTGDPSIFFNRVLDHSSQVLLSGKNSYSELSRRHRTDCTAGTCVFPVVSKETGALETVWPLHFAHVLLTQPELHLEVQACHPITGET
jgi:hypothetical protein